MKKLLWLDDYRNPLEDDWLNFSPFPRPFETVWIKNPYNFKKWISKNGLPDGICFDHDLGFEETGYDCAKWLVDYCLNRNLPVPPFAIQSANPVGAENIASLLNNYTEHWKKQN